VTPGADDDQVGSDLARDIGDRVRGLGSDMVDDLQSGLESLPRELLHYVLELASTFSSSANTASPSFVANL
jgi:hypothetical protein